MKRYFLLVLVSLLFSTATVFAAETANVPQAKEKSEIERYMQMATKIKSSEIDYAYISTSMFKQIFKMILPEVTVSGNVQITTKEGNPFGSIKYLRRFQTTGKNGYNQLFQVMHLFMQEEEEVMGMELMALNREDGTQTVIYGDETSVLVVNDDGDELAVVFIAGLPYDAFMKMSNGDAGFDFGF
jgi:hypothetical protein